MEANTGVINGGGKDVPWPNTLYGGVTPWVVIGCEVEKAGRLLIVAGPISKVDQSDMPKLGTVVP